MLLSASARVVTRPNKSPLSTSYPARRGGEPTIPRARDIFSALGILIATPSGRRHVRVVCCLAVGIAGIRAVAAVTLPLAVAVVLPKANTRKQSSTNQQANQRSN